MPEGDLGFSNSHKHHAIFASYPQLAAQCSASSDGKQPSWFKQTLQVAYTPDFTSLSTLVWPPSFPCGPGIWTVGFSHASTHLPFQMPTWEHFNSALWLGGNREDFIWRRSASTQGHPGLLGSLSPSLCSVLSSFLHHPQIATDLLPLP